jgi:hypothetical protein
MMRSFVRAIKPTVRAIVPERWRRQVRLHLSKRWDAKFQHQPAEKVFTAIYKEGKWGEGLQGDFYSGSGSHDPQIVLPYIEAVSTFLKSLPRPPSLVDLGCGDFNIGSQLRPYCGKYTACDVVPDLISRNQTKFSNFDVDFRCLDITHDEFPDGDVVVLRQVLQHLSNGQILKVVPKLYRYKFLVLTEHLPADSDFPPNIEKPTGAMVRVASRSGVVLIQPPFNLKARSEKVICSNDRAVGHYPSSVRTTLYEL